ncbi:MAG: hypothetical protein IJ193_00440 [Bacilli bacterium]|nr:hypothetical protein [Bacilli bacterium]
MFDDYDVKELLQEAYEKGFNDGIDQTCDYITENYELEEDNSFDLEDDYKYYTESSKNVRQQMDNLNGYTDNGIAKEYYPKYHNKDWTKFTNRQVFSKKTGERSAFSRPGSYRVNNNGPEGASSEPRGRIKSGYKDSEDPRSSKLKAKVKANADRREAEKKERLRPFKNKGNQY